MQSNRETKSESAKARLIALYLPPKAVSFRFDPKGKQLPFTTGYNWVHPDFANVFPEGRLETGLQACPNCVLANLEGTPYNSCTMTNNKLACLMGCYLNLDAL